MPSLHLELQKTGSLNWPHIPAHWNSFLRISAYEVGVRHDTAPMQQTALKAFLPNSSSYISSEQQLKALPYGVLCSWFTPICRRLYTCSFSSVMHEIKNLKFRWKYQKGKEISVCSIMARLSCRSPGFSHTDVMMLNKIQTPVWDDEKWGSVENSQTGLSWEEGYGSLYSVATLYYNGEQKSISGIASHTGFDRHIPYSRMIILIFALTPECLHS